MKMAILAAAAALALTAIPVSAAAAGSWTTRWMGPAGGTYEGSGPRRLPGFGNVHRPARRRLAPLRQRARSRTRPVGRRAHDRRPRRPHMAEFLDVAVGKLTARDSKTGW